MFARLESQCSSSHGGKYPSAAEMDEQKRGSWRLLTFAKEGGRGLGRGGGGGVLPGAGDGDVGRV